MGTWGHGNFQSDGALDELGLLFHHIIGRIREAFTYEHVTTLYDDWGDAQIIANVDILSSLCEHYKTGPDLKLEEITRWKADYLVTFDRIAVSPTPEEEFPDYLRKRRENIVATFDRLYKITKSNWED